MSPIELSNLLTYAAAIVITIAAIVLTKLQK